MEDKKLETPEQRLAQPRKFNGAAVARALRAIAEELDCGDIIHVAGGFTMARNGGAVEIRSDIVLMYPDEL